MINPDIKRSILLKFEPLEDIIPLFNNYAFHVSKTLEHIKGIVEEYKKLEIPNEKEKCNNCGEEKYLFYQKEKEKFCSNCFSNKWSEFTLFKAWKEELRKLEPKFAHQGYYYGAISTAVKVFKSFLTKKEEREKQIKIAKESCIVLDGQIVALDFDIKKTKSNIKRGKNETELLAKKEKEKDDLTRKYKFAMKKATQKNISFPVFQGNEVYFGKQGMFILKQENGNFTLEISDYKMLRNKIPCILKIGDRTKIHKACRGEVEVKESLLFCKKCNSPVPKKECRLNYQEQFILKCIEKNEQKIVYPKIIRRQGDKGFQYFFMFPARYSTKAIQERKNLQEYIEKNKNKIISNKRVQLDVNMKVM